MILRSPDAFEDMNLTAASTRIDFSADALKSAGQAERKILRMQMNKDDAVSLAIDSILRYGCRDITSEELELRLVKEFRDNFEAEIKAKLSRGIVYPELVTSLINIDAWTRSRPVCPRTWPKLRC